MLWVLRDEIGLTGTKFGCGIAQCGACTIHVDGVATRSCQFAGERRGRQEDPSPSRGSARRICTPCRRPGSRTTCRNAAIASPARSWPRRASSRTIPSPTDADIDAEITNICRCGTYPRIRAAIHRAAALAKTLRSAAMNAHSLAPRFRRRQPFGRRRPRRSPSPRRRCADAPPLGPEPWSPEPLATPRRGQRLRRRSSPTTRSCCASPKSEMGQGVMTSLAMIVAEELECDFAKVKVEYASANRNLLDGGVYGQMGTGGSSSVRRSRVFLQQAGASARARLIAAAAARWGVAPALASARDGSVLHDASGRSAPYGELAARRRQDLACATSRRSRRPTSSS